MNLLGDVWFDGEPNWANALSAEEVKLHLYGKSDARVGRKMGHLTALATSPHVAAGQALAARRALLPGNLEPPMPRYSEEKVHLRGFESPTCGLGDPFQVTQGHRKDCEHLE